MDIFYAATTITLGNGKKTSFWEARWLTGRKPKDIAPLIFDASKRKRWNVNLALNGNAWVNMIKLDNDFTMAHFSQFLDLWTLCQGVQLHDDLDDDIRWNLTASGHYSAKSAYEMSSEEMEMGNGSDQSDHDIHVQNQENEVPEDNGDGKEIVLVDDEPTEELQKEEEAAAANKDKEDGDAQTGRKEMAARSDMWNHFTKIFLEGGKYLHMRCAAHIVNLIVSDGLKEVDLSMKRVRAAVRYIKNGTTRLDKFKECADLEKVDTKAFLNLDVCTRWNSTHDMLKAAIIYEKVFARYAEEDIYYTIDLTYEKSSSVKGPGVPDEQDWDNSKKMAEFLRHFSDLTVRVSASLNVTANTFFHEIGEVNLLVRGWLESEDSLQRDMGKRMKEKYDKYWGKWHENDPEKERGKGKDKTKEKKNINLMIFIATVLDPRYKLSEYTEIAIGEMYGEGNGQKVWSAINKCLYELFEEYRKNYAPVVSDSAPQSSDVPRKEGGKGGTASMMKELVAKKMRLNTGASNNSKSELEKYLGEDCEDIDSTNFDILAWWKTNSSRFPILAHLARDVLAIPISTLASESAFSTGGRVLDDFRTSLTPFMVEAIICTQDWLRRSSPINIQENTEELAKLEEGTSKAGPSVTTKSRTGRKKK
ncbi:hypothetical protein QYE76_033211 [Lolium multiflorum]|uniref:Transposase n=1 Tax=Lolium multiflorum TaxID=4521 RepID=A0AAD8QYP0_LOLMU|nr:hypothetical protein QYE76_033211 [Lolium multiflorum]